MERTVSRVSKAEAAMTSQQEAMYSNACGNVFKMFRHFPNSITLTATAGAGITKLRFKDACGLFDDLGVDTGAATQEFGITGPVSADAVRKFVQTHAGRISLINYQANVDTQLNNKIKLKTASIDEETATAKIFDVAVDKRNTQFQTTLQTVRPHKGEAWLTNTSGISVGTAATNVVSLTLQFDKWSRYESIVQANC